MKMRPHFVLGIAPGLTGAIAFLREDGSLYLLDMPVERVCGHARIRMRVNAAQLFGYMRGMCDNAQATAFIKSVAAMPGQGVSSVFGLGDSFGVVRACCCALGMRTVFVSPQSLVRRFGLIGAHKDASRTRATEIFPQYGAQWASKKHRWRAEAALLAEYGRALV